jgi:bifunctional UDP-N-acetylglucosamine pyrophosphorylase / glucosamine-1-phosphate N-acetyltransferase
MTDKLTIVILAAGLGTRMKSRKAKVLHEAGGMALVEHVVRSGLALTSPDRIVVVVGHQADQVQSRLAPTGVRFALQAEQKGTAHALEVCRSLAGDAEGKLIVLYGDCPLLSVTTLRGLIDHQSAARVAGAVITTVLDDPSGYGRIILDSDGYVAGIVEEKVATPEQKAIRQINSGIYCFEAGPLWKHLSEIEPNPVSREYYLTDIVEVLRRAGHKISPRVHSDAEELLGINTRVELALVDRIFRERKTTDLMLDGVTIRRPETVTVDYGVRAGIDTIVEPFAQLLGTTSIGANCRIGAGAIIKNSEIGDGVEIHPYTIVNTSRVDSGSSIGPFARLRMDNHVEAGAHIGNFVELKKTRFGAGAKAGHLAYLGDSDIGADVNIGAGTITCNYDGVTKHKTVIGDHAFVGSNSTLVAPLEIGPDCYIAAGSAITDPVPDEALGIGRSRQVNKEGWAKRRKEKSVHS